MRGKEENRVKRQEREEERNKIKIRQKGYIYKIQKINKRVDKIRVETQEWEGK